MRLPQVGARRPVQLSGGQRQRVALARAIVNRPTVLLLDEPLGALDLKLRQEMQVFLKDLQQDLGITFVYVTHDQEEALTMSDRLAVFNEGRIEQIGSPAEVYEHPETEFVAGFVGISNVLERDGRRFTIRPEKIHMTEGIGGDGETGVIREVVYVGRVTRYIVDLHAGGELVVVRQNLETSSHQVLEAKGKRVRLEWRPEHTYEIQGGKRVTRITRAHVLVAAVAAALCIPAAGISAGNGLPTKIGPGEGQLNLVAWEGYTQPQWVKPFQKATGCVVHAKYAGSSDEMVTLMRQGGGSQYDMVSASGDASLRLIFGKDVQPINVKLIPDYKNFIPQLKSPPHNTIEGRALRALAAVGPEHAALQHDEGEARTDELVVDLQLEVQGQDHRAGQPDPDRGCGAVPLEDEALARDQGSVRAELDPVQRGGEPAQAAEAADQEVLGPRLGRDRPVQGRRRRDRRVVAVPDEHAGRGQGPGQGSDPQGRRDRLGRHVDALVAREASELRVHVDEVGLDADGAGAAGDLLR